MKFGNCLNIAAYNIVRRKKTSFIIAVSLFFVSFVVLVLLFYGSTVSSAMIGYSSDYMASACATYSVVVQKDMQNEYSLFLDDESFKKIKSLEQVRDVNVFYNVNIDNGLGGSCGQLNDFIFTIDEKEYSAHITENNKNLDDIFFAISAYDLSCSVFSENLQEEYNCKYKSGIFLCGDTLQNKNDIILSHKLLSKIGFTENEMKNLIGKTIDISCVYYNEYDMEEGNPSYQKQFENYRICGILKDEIYELSTGYCTDIIMPYNEETSKKCYDGMICVNMDGFMNGESVMNELKKITKREFSCSKNFGAYLQLSKQNVLLNRVIAVIFGILLLAVTLNVIYVVSFNMEKKSSYIGMLKAIGMTNGKICLIQFIELLLLYAAAFAVAVVLGGFLCHFLCDGLNGLLNLSLSFSISAYSCSVAFTFVFMLILLAVIMVVSSTGILKRQIIQLVNKE